MQPGSTGKTCIEYADRTQSSRELQGCVLLHHLDMDHLNIVDASTKDPAHPLITHIRGDPYHWATAPPETVENQDGRGWHNCCTQNVQYIHE